MATVRVGRLTPKGKIHLALDGQIADDHSKTIRHDCTRPDLAASKNLCRRCFTPNLVGAAQRMLQSASGIAAERHRMLLADVVPAVTTPEQTAADTDLAARIRATMLAAGSIMPLARAAAASRVG